MSLYTIHPLDDRTGFTGEHRRSPFSRPGSGWSRESIPFSQTRELLERELRALGAEDVILEVDVLPGQIRLDGELYASAKVNSPAVRLHFDSEHGHLTYATDAFTTWQDNVRAIALALEALCKVDRYQVGRGGDQYRGYLALEAGSGATALGAETPMTRDDAIGILSTWAYGDSVDPALLHDSDEARRATWKRARKHAHPDNNSGARSAWDQVERAAKVLGLSS